jgi:hypothetical protein
MQNNNFDQDALIEKMQKEIKFLEEEVEMQAYVSGLWVRYHNTMKKLINTEHSGTPLAEAVNSSIMEGNSWEDIWNWISEAKKSEKEYFERIESDIENPSDLKSLKTEVDFLKGVIRALLSTREMKLESVLIGYKEWNSELSKEICELLEHNGLVSD